MLNASAPIVPISLPGTTQYVKKIKRRSNSETLNLLKTTSFCLEHQNPLFPKIVVKPGQFQTFYEIGLECRILEHTFLKTQESKPSSKLSERYLNLNKYIKAILLNKQPHVKRKGIYNGWKVIRL